MKIQEFITIVQNKLLIKPQKTDTKLSDLELKIYNEGERLIPGVTHDKQEKTRHLSSYDFFKKIIKSDINNFIRSQKRPFKIVDLGCGVGYGCVKFSTLKNTVIYGIDSSKESILYANRYYKRKNIIFEVRDLVSFIPSMPVFDYAVSRGVFEHIKNGLKLARLTKWKYRFIFDVPFNEKKGNIHHKLLHISERDFSIFPQAELFYQDLEGVIYDISHKPVKPNMIMCILSNPKLPKIKELNLKFPLGTS